MASDPDLEIVESIGSTNAEVLVRCSGGAQLREGWWLIADQQSAGKGRLGRAWLDGRGNFMGSTVVHLRTADPAAHTLALLAGLAVHQAVRPLLTDPKRLLLKWPNDVLLDDAKLAGILLERRGNVVVVGIGVNLAQAPAVAGRRTTALKQQGVDVPRQHFATTLKTSFSALLHRWRSEGSHAIIDAWTKAGPEIGRALSVQVPGEPPLTGAFAGLGADGALLLHLEDGVRRAIYAGDVALVGVEEEG